MVSEPKDHINMDDKKTPFAGLSTRLSLKLKPSAAENPKEFPYDQHNCKHILYCFFNSVSRVIISIIVSISSTVSLTV